MMDETNTMDSGPLVSVIIPTCNREVFLGEAIESVLRQGYQPLEIIVVDDGSTDGTADLVARYGEKLRYIWQPNSGPAAARNRGLCLARGDVIGFLDSDDLWIAEKLKHQISYLAHHPLVDVVLGYSRIIHQRTVGANKCELADDQEPKASFSLGSALFRRRVFEVVGVFDPKMRFGEDDDWFMRARERGIQMVRLTRVTQLRRTHDGNMTRDAAARIPDLLRLLKNHRDRRQKC